LLSSSTSSTAVQLNQGQTKSEIRKVNIIVEFKVCMTEEEVRRLQVLAQEKEIRDQLEVLQKDSEARDIPTVVEQQQEEIWREVWPQAEIEEDKYDQEAADYYFEWSGQDSDGEFHHK
jgi:hypothetical protein